MSIQIQFTHREEKTHSRETLWLLLSHNPFSLIYADFSLIFLGLFFFFFLEGGIIQIQGRNRFSTCRHLKFGGREINRSKVLIWPPSFFLPDVSFNVSRTSRKLEVISPPALLIYLQVACIWRWLKPGSWAADTRPPGHPDSPLWSGVFADSGMIAAMPWISFRDHTSPAEEQGMLNHLW